MNSPATVLSFLVRFAGLVVAGCVALWRGLVTGIALAVEIVRSLRRLRGGLRCPRGHLVPTEGATYACGSCGFTYEGGSQWLCPNPECGATTPYVACPTCSLSVSSPFRFLHR